VRFEALGAATVASVNIPAAFLIWLMTIPMLKIDFGTPLHLQPLLAPVCPPTGRRFTAQARAYERVGLPSARAQQFAGY
jgi:hypothetical protein